jgi:hypothetical protein
MSKEVAGWGLKIIGVGAMVAGTVFTGGWFGAAIITGGLVASTVGENLTASARDASMDTRIEDLETRVDPYAPAKWLFGEAAFPTQLAFVEAFDQDDDGEKDHAVQVIGGVFHPIDSFGQFVIDDEEVSFNSSGVVVSGDWAGAVEQYTRLGSDSQTAIPSQGSSWPGDAQGKGLAHYMLVWDLTHDRLESGIPTRITQVAKGAPVYDPRQDDTAGGSGDQRADDQSTWEYGSGDAPAGSNWALVVLHYLLGWRQNGELAYGMGKDPANIDMDSVIEAANVCDELVDGIPRYHVGGTIELDGDHERVIGELESTVGGSVTKSQGVYSIWAPHDDLSPAQFSITEDDLIREAGVNFRDAVPISELANTARGQYVEPDERWVPVDYPDVVDSDAKSNDDGIERELQIDFPYLTSHERAQRVAHQRIRRTRFGRTWVVRVGPEYLGVQPMDVGTLNIREANDQDATVRVVEKTISLSRGLIVLTLAEESSAIYDTSEPLGTPAERSRPDETDPGQQIDVLNYSVTAVKVEGDAGSSSAALKATWKDRGPLVRRTEVEFKLSSADVWTPASGQQIEDGGPGILIPGVERGTEYDVRARHISRWEVPGLWATETNVTTDVVPAPAIRPSPTFEGGRDDAFFFTGTLDATKGQEGTDQLQVQYRVVGTRTGRVVQDWTNWDDAPVDISEQRAVRESLRLQYKARDVGLPDNPTSSTHSTGIDPLADILDLPPLGRGPLEDDYGRSGMGGEAPGGQRLKTPYYSEDGQDELLSSRQGRVRNAVRLDSGVLGSDGARLGATAKVTEQGRNDHTESIDYAENYQNVPLWRSAGGGYKVSDPNLSEPQQVLIAIENHSKSGGTLKAVVSEVPSNPTQQSVPFSADTHGDVGIDDDDYSANKEDASDSSDAWDDTYRADGSITANGDINCIGGDCWEVGGSIKIGFYINDGTGPTLVETTSHSASGSNDTTSFSIEASYPGLGTHSGKEFWMGVEDESGQGGSYSPSEVVWETGGGDPQTVSATQDSSGVRWFAYAKEDG